MMITLNAKQFTWTDVMGTVEISSLRLQHPPTIVVVQGRTRTITFVCQRAHRDIENDVVYWQYLSDDREFGLTIYND